MRTTIAQAWTGQGANGVTGHQAAVVLGITEESARTVMRCYQVLLWTRLGIRLQAESHSLNSYDGKAATQQPMEDWVKQCAANQEELACKVAELHRFTQCLQIALQTLADRVCGDDHDITAVHSFATGALMQAALCPLYAALERWTDELVRVHTYVKLIDFPALHGHAVSRSVIEYAEWVGFLCVAMGTSESPSKRRHLSTASVLLRSVSAFGTTNAISPELRD